jgi:hypothetical protein
MQATIIPNRDTTEISKLLLDKYGEPKIVGHASLACFDQYTISNFCVQNGFYGLPTWELVNWLQERIDGRHAIEIAAGHGALSLGLGIRATDSKVQENENFKEMMSANRQAPVRYGSHVEQLEASAAVRHYKPEIVVASWATQKWQPGYKCGFTEGVDFLDIVSLRFVREIILIGNAYTHGKMEMVKKTCVAEAKFPYLVSRSLAVAMNRIYILRKK